MPNSVYWLPKPPSTNQLYSGRRHKTATYKAWIKEAGQELVYVQRARPVEGPFELLIGLPGNLDLDNIKAVPDLLVAMHIIPDDRRKFMRKLVVTPADTLTVEIRGIA